MEVFTFPFYVHLLAVVLLVWAGSFLWMYPTEKVNSFRVLGVSFILFGLVQLTLVLLYEAGDTDQLLFCYSAGNMFRLLFLPLSYLYIRSVLLQQPLTRIDLLHAFPFVIYIGIYTFFSSDIPFREFTRMQEWVDNDLYLQPHSLPARPDLLLFTILFFVYWLLSARLIIQTKPHNSTAFSGRSMEQRWLMGYNGIQFLTFFASFLLLIKHPGWHLWLSVQVFSSFGGIFLSLSLWWWPEKLQQVKDTHTHKPEVPEKEPAVEKAVDAITPEDTVHKGVSLGEARTEEISERLSAFMESNRPFLRHSYSIQDLSNDVNIPTYQLSAFLNKKSGLRFHDYLNAQRIRYCTQELQKGRWKNLTLEALAFECGFNNRNTFTTAFKRFTGMNPSDFIRSMKK